MPIEQRPMEDIFDQADRFEESGDLRSAFRCYLAAAEAGDSWGQINLGNYYASGQGVRKDLKRAAYWYRKAYRNGNGCGALNLAIDWRNQGNQRSAEVWFKRAVAMREGAAYIQLAKMYLARRGRRREASRLLHQALRLDRDYLSDLEREEATSLLQEITRAHDAA